jgi:hypothetical protein
MTPAVENILVWLLVVAATVYMAVRLRRMAAGKSNCVCGSDTCDPASVACNSSIKGEAASGGLPLLPPSCSQRGCGKM